MGFESFDHRVCAYYRLGHNSHGLEDEIILNEVHLDRPLYSILEVVLHEQLHLWQQRRGEHPVNRNYHNKEFVEKAESLGLHPFPVIGCHWKPADGAFEALLKEYGVTRPVEEIEVTREEKKNWWEDNGQKMVLPRVWLNVRVGVRRDIRLLCGDCEDKTGKEVLFVRDTQ